MASPFTGSMDGSSGDAMGEKSKDSADLGLPVASTSTADAGKSHSCLHTEADAAAKINWAEGQALRDSLFLNTLDEPRNAPGVSVQTVPALEGLLPPLLPSQVAKAQAGVMLQSGKAVALKPMESHAEALLLQRGKGAYQSHGGRSHSDL